MLALCDAGQAFARSLRRLGGGEGDWEVRQKAVERFDALRHASLGAHEAWKALAATLETERGALEARSALEEAARARGDALGEVALRTRAREAREAAVAEAEAFLRSAEESEERRARLRDQLKAAFGAAYLEVLRLRAEEEAAASSLASLREWCGAAEGEAFEEARARAASQAHGAAEALRAERRSPGRAEEACRARKRPRTSPP
ncbi:unnamed protein product [Prorocentrum cordatum]|uniref:Uncharacterized protein n=1 Tax=Prorocentrum cordatum TaxID=2364126 RepID=A0ABN9U355_9DINO|nr:unnamed protein product [Polarella glacialis]